MKNSVTIKRLAAFFAVILAIQYSIPLNGQSDKPDFTGTWILNTEKSTLPQGGAGAQRMMGGDFSVTQSADLLTKTRIGPEGTARITKYTLDGKESINTSPRGESRSTASWSADGKSLTIVTTFGGNGISRQQTEVWSLVSPASLTITTTRSNPNGGEVKVTIVYDKK